MRRYRKGQATIEALISVSFLVVIIGVTFNELLSAQRESENELINTRNIIWDNRFNGDFMRKSDDYRLKKRLGSILEPIDELIDVELPMTNLWETQERQFPMVRLTDSWGAKNKEELSVRPSKLVVNNIFSGKVINLIQDGLGFLFLSRELSSDSLKFGYINADVVPQDVLLEECSHDC